MALASWRRAWLVRSVADVPAPDASSPTAAWCAAMTAEDPRAVAATLSPDVVLRSPITASFAFHGREQVATLMEDVFAAVDEFTYTEDVGDGRRRCVRGEGHVRGEAFAETLLLVVDADGLVADIEIFVRPMPGLLALAAALGPRVARRRSAGRARAVQAMIGPLAFMARSGEGLASRLAAP